MPERTVTIASAVGLHARPAALFVQAAAAQPVRVSIRKDGTDHTAAIAADSIMSVMSLGARHGDDVVLSADGDGAEAALDHLVGLLATDLD